MLGELNVWAILAAAVSAFLLGGIWYGPLFKRVWCREAGVEQGRVQAVPIVFGAVLAHLGQSGPAEIPKKRLFIYRQALWQARRDGVTLRFPPAHPCSPLAALRLCVAAGSTPAPVARTLGIDAPAAAIADPAVKARLRTNTDAALAAGVFGVPTLAVGDDLYCGNDSHDPMQAVLEEPGLLASVGLDAADAPPVGVERRR